jgi:hypothetical protein
MNIVLEHSYKFMQDAVNQLGDTTMSFDDFDNLAFDSAFGEHKQMPEADDEPINDED